MTTINVELSSQSPVKIRAVEAAFRHFGYKADVTGHEVETGVAEQPSTLEETIAGAKNRHEALKLRLGMGAYLVSIESGVIQLPEEDDLRGCEAVIVTAPDGSEAIGFDLGVSYPRELAALVPDTYPDWGVLVQQKFGITEKDPVTYLTNGKITRAKLLEFALIKALAQLELSAPE